MLQVSTAKKLIELKEVDLVDDYPYDQDVADDDSRNTSSITASQRKRNAYKSKCHLFVTTSTIPNAGLGIFTGVDLEIDDTIGYADMVIPVDAIASTIRNPVEDYAWHPRIYRGDTTAFAPGFLSLMNSHLALLNIGQVEPAVDVFPHETDATRYHYLQSMVEQDVPAGGELFTFYGDHWFEGRERYKGRPIADDFRKAEKLTKLLAKIAPDSDDVTKGLWQLIKHEIPFRSGIILAFPNQFEHVSSVVSGGVQSLHQPFAMRDVDEELVYTDNSRCLDMIRQGQSDVHNLGALATMPIAKGTIITGSPLIQTVQQRLNKYAYVWDKETKTYKPSTSDRTDYSVLMNYCFGHHQSSILLCPYGIAVSYINHHPKRKPNVAIRWTPDHQLSQNNTAFDMTPIELAKQNPMLAIDYIALRDIKEGEEIFIDYGKLWDTKFKQHPRQSLQVLASVDKYNRQPILLSEAEQQSLPYPDNLQLRCHPDVLTYQYKYNYEKLWQERRPNISYECSILERFQAPNDPNQTVYAARLNVKGEIIQAGYIPREYFKFFERKTEPVPFRFPMQLPDKMVPEAWKDLKPKKR